MWNFSVRVSDYSESVIINVFGDQGDLIMGMQAIEYFEFKDNKEKVKLVLFQALFRQLSFMV